MSAPTFIPVLPNVGTGINPNSAIASIVTGTTGSDWTDWYVVVGDTNPATQFFQTSSGTMVANNLAAALTWLAAGKAPIVGQGVIATANAAGLIKVQCPDTSQMTTGQQIYFKGDTSAANGTFAVTVNDGTHYTLQGSTFTVSDGGNSTAVSATYVATKAALNSAINDINKTIPHPQYANLTSGGDLTLNNPLATWNDVTVGGAFVNLPQANLVGSPAIGVPIIIKNLGALSFRFKDFIGNIKATVQGGATATITLNSNSTTSGVWSFSLPVEVGAGTLNPGNMLILDPTTASQGWTSIDSPNTMNAGQWPFMLNGTLVCSVSGNALTIAVKDYAGNDPNTGSQVIFAFRDPTQQNGDITFGKLATALSITVPSGASLGHVSAREQQIIVYAIYNAGTVELAVAAFLIDPVTRLTTTTAIGAGSTSATTVYSTSARTNISVIPIARLLSNQTTAGTWANGPSASAPGIVKQDLAPFAVSTNFVYVYRTANQTGIVTTTLTKVQYNVVGADPNTCFDATTNYRYQPKSAGKYQVTGSIHFNMPTGGAVATVLIVIVQKNGTAVSQAAGYAPANGDIYFPSTIIVDMNGTTDYLEVFGFQASGVNQNFGGTQAATYFTAQRIAA